MIKIRTLRNFDDMGYCDVEMEISKNAVDALVKSHIFKDAKRKINFGIPDQDGSYNFLYENPDALKEIFESIENWEELYGMGVSVGIFRNGINHDGDAVVHCFLNGSKIYPNYDANDFERIKYEANGAFMHLLDGEYTEYGIISDVERIYSLSDESLDVKIDISTH